MINSYNSAILFGAFVLTIASQFVLISYQKYKWFGNPDNNIVRDLTQKICGKFAEKNKIYFGFGIIFHDFPRVQRIDCEEARNREEREMMNDARQWINSGKQRRNNFFFFEKIFIQIIFQGLGFLFLTSSNII